MTAVTLSVGGGVTLAGPRVDLWSRADMTAGPAEALAFCDALWPLASRLELAAQHLGPVTHQVALALIARLASYERRHLPDGDPMALEAVA